MHVLGKPVAAPGNSYYVLVILRTLPQGLPQEKNVPAEVGLFHKGVGPDHLHQIVFEDKLITVAHQNQKDLKRLRRQRDGLTATKQQFLLRINSKSTEFVEVFNFLICACSH